MHVHAAHHHPQLRHAPNVYTLLHMPAGHHYQLRRLRCVHSVRQVQFCWRVCGHPRGMHRLGSVPHRWHLLGWHLLQPNNCECCFVAGWVGSCTKHYPVCNTAKPCRDTELLAMPTGWLDWTVNPLIPCHPKPPYAPSLPSLLLAALPDLRLILCHINPPALPPCCLARSQAHSLLH